MSDPATLAATAVAVVAPYLAAGATEAAKTLGKEAVESGKRVLAWLKANLTGRGAEALTELEVAPVDDNAADLRKQLGKALAAEPQLMEQLRQLLAELPASTAAVQTMTTTGDSNVSGQLAGQGNTMKVTR